MESAEDQTAAIKRQAAGDQAALEALEFDWGEVYLIGRDDTGGWWARRRDQVDARLTASGPDGLRVAIRADYELRRVPRDLSARDEKP